MGELIPIFSKLVSYAVAFAGIVGVAYFVVGAFKYTTASGSAQKIDEAKQAMKQSLVGVVLILVAFTLVNTLISLVGESSGALQIGQLAGSDSSTIEGPTVVRVIAYDDVIPDPDKTKGVQIQFSEPVEVENEAKMHIRSRRYGLGSVESIPPAKTVVNFEHPPFVVTRGCAGTDKIDIYIVEDLLLGSGATIRDEDGNPAIYAFPPTPVIHCK